MTYSTLTLLSMTMLHWSGSRPIRFSPPRTWNSSGTASLSSGLLSPSLAAMTLSRPYTLRAFSSSASSEGKSGSSSNGMRCVASMVAIASKRFSSEGHGAIGVGLGAVGGGCHGPWGRGSCRSSRRGGGGRQNWNGSLKTGERRGEERRGGETTKLEARWEETFC